MRRVPLGRSGVVASRLCVGTGTTGFNCQSQQSRQPPQALGALLRRAYDLGINFWDTSDDYGTHPHVREGLQGLDRRDVVITTKTHAATAARARASVRQSLEELGVAYVDILLMHEVDASGEFDRRQPALAELHALKREGLIRAVGLSTHNIDTLEYVAGRLDLDILFTNVNCAGDHMDADRRDYFKALQVAFDAGTGVYVHKTLGEGRLAHRLQEAVEHNLSLPFVHAVCVGLNTAAELGEVAAIAEAFDAPRAAT